MRWAMAAASGLAIMACSETTGPSTTPDMAAGSSAAVASVAVTPGGPITIHIRSSWGRRVRVTVRKANGSLDTKSAVTWHSSDPSVADFFVFDSRSVKIRPWKFGSAVFTATAGARVDTLRVTID